MTMAPGVSVLIVDDDPVITMLIRRQVLSLGYRPVTATDRAGALAAAERQQFMLLILDLHLAGERGTEVVRELRQRGLDCPALFISGDSSLDAVDESLQVGTFFVPKPFTMADLSEGIWTALRQR
jgi:DNA-binding response OmpR family regulator